MRRLLLLLVVTSLAWPWPETAFAQDGAAVPTRLTIPGIQLDAAITAVGWLNTPRGAAWQVPDHAVGWHRTSAMPGQAGNLVLTGHHNIKGKVFRRLKELAVGDTLTIYAGETAFDYVVTERLILRELGLPSAQRLANARWIGPFPHERVTLVTCYPDWANTHRLIVVARPVAPP